MKEITAFRSCVKWDMSGKPRVQTEAEFEGGRMIRKTISFEDYKKLLFNSEKEEITYFSVDHPRYYYQGFASDQKGTFQVILTVPSGPICLCLKNLKLRHNCRIRLWLSNSVSKKEPVRVEAAMPLIRTPQIMIPLYTVIPMVMCLIADPFVWETSALIVHQSKMQTNLWTLSLMESTRGITMNPEKIPFPSTKKTNWLKRFWKKDPSQHSGCIL